MSILNVVKVTECSCDTCKKMCLGPCWGTPDDMQKIIDAGFGARLQIDWYEANIDGEDTEVLTGALKGREGNYSLSYPRSKEGCTFFNNGLCDLHDSGLKPTEGKLAYHEECHNIDVPQKIHDAILETWRTEKGRALVAHWKSVYFIGQSERPSSDIFSMIASSIHNGF